MGAEIPPIPDGSAIITPNQQYAELQAVRVAVEKLVNTIDPALAEVRKDVHDLDQKTSKELDVERAERKADVDALRTDVSSLKLWRAGITGALVLLSSLVAYGLLNLADLGIGGK